LEAAILRKLGGPVTGGRELTRNGRNYIKPAIWQRMLKETDGSDELYNQNELNKSGKPRLRWLEYLGKDKFVLVLN
jgi:hypothetical protein